MKSRMFALTKKIEQQQNKLPQPWVFGFAFLLIVLATLVIYQPVLSKFFLLNELDDLCCLKKIVENPLFLRDGFVSCWRGNHFYYRPVTDIIWAVEYLVCGADGFYLRICSIVVMLWTCVIIGLLAQEIISRSITSSLLLSQQNLWPLWIIALFAFYPLHCEPINWFVAQHDVLVTLLSVFSFWAYLRWRRPGHVGFLIISMISFVLALLTKEMSATLPLILLSYEVLCIKDGALIKSFLFTLPYWVILSMYFLLRKAVLNAFIGEASDIYYFGYVHMVKAWIYSIRKIFIPIDISVIPQNSLLTMSWCLIIIIALLLGIDAFRRSKNIRLGIFLFVWFLLSLVPAYKVLAINPNLAGARAAYLSTVPLCFFLAYGIGYFRYSVKLSIIVNAAGGILLLLAALVLYCNNQAYSNLPYRSDKFVSELQKLYEREGEDRDTRIIGLPHIGNISIITKKPFLQRDILNCSALDANNQAIPFGYLKSSASSCGHKIRFLYWDNNKQKLKPTAPYYLIPPVMNFPTDRYKKIWYGHELKSIIHLGKDSPGRIIWKSDGTLYFTSNRRSYLEVDLDGFPCWPIDFVKFRIKLNQSKNKPPYQCDLRFANYIHPDCYWLKTVSLNSFLRKQITPTLGEQNLIFSLRSYPDWILGGKCQKLKLLLPPGINMSIMSMDLPEADTVIPIVSGSSYIKLNQQSQERLIKYDAGHVQGSAQAVLEIIGPDKDFEVLYSDRADKNAVFNIPVNGTKGLIKVERKDFLKTGFYKARMRALDKDGNQVGLAGDHFIINVEK